MNKKIIIAIIVVVILAVVLLLANRGREASTEPMPLEQAKTIAQEWITKEAPTYAFDGLDLALIDAEDMGEGRYKFNFSFESRQAGYGDREGQVLAQAITPHTIEVLVENGQITRAVTDGVYDEITEEMIEESTSEIMRISLYFIMTIDDQEMIVEVPRDIPRTITPAKAALEALVAGPITGGILTAIPEGTEVMSINIEDGVATADFNEKLQEGVAGSARVTAIREQIEKTLLQFDTVNQVVITVNGQSEGILEP